MKNKLWHTPKLRLLSAFLAAAMALTMLPAAAFAEEATDYELVVNFGITTGNPALPHITLSPSISTAARTGAGSAMTGGMKATIG